MNLILKQILSALLLTALAVPALARSLKGPSKAQVKPTVKAIAKAQERRRRIIEINLGPSKAETKRQPASVNGKAVTFVPEQKSLSRKVVAVDRYADGVADNSFDALHIPAPKKPEMSTGKNPKGSKISAEIDNETLASSQVPRHIGEQTMADVKTIKRLKNAAKKKF